VTCHGLQQCAWLAEKRTFGVLKERGATSCYVSGQERFEVCLLGMKPLPACLVLLPFQVFKEPVYPVSFKEWSWKHTIPFPNLLPHLKKRAADPWVCVSFGV